MKSNEFTVVTDAHLIAENERQKFVHQTRDACVPAVLMEAFAVWTAKLQPLIHLRFKK